MKQKLIYAGVELTAESIKATHQWFADNARACIAEVKRGAVRVNNEAKYFADCNARAAMHDAHANGTAPEEYRYSVTFLQFAHTRQTGECVALLP
jgi:hypothetical protein